MEWKNPSSPVRKKFKITPSADEVLTVIWEAQGRLLFNFLEVGTINATRYCDTLSKSEEAIRKKCPGLLRSGVQLLDDIRRPHSVTATQNHIATLGWECLHHSHYSPDLAQSDFHVFQAVKKNLARRQFGSTAEVKQAFKCFFRIQSSKFFLGELFEAYQAV
ncbi:hypothetical protein TNCV_2398031 [Trichonephila clavipes]|uniref:Transposase n=1 Tax=Trichonephila clavipes TaxID=2585209 RepID=A0A8X6VQY4_TRICX|nr:hypothetical protein TNCV_2398031 [Trichonephila clavipes]